MKETKISDFTLERYLLNELPEKQIAEISRLCLENAELRDRIESIKNENSNILKQYDEQEIVAEIKRRFETQIKEPVRKAKKPKFNILSLRSLTAFSAALALIILIPVIKAVFFPEFGSRIEMINIKGDNSIYIYRKNRNDIEQLQNGATAGKGDLLQIAYLSVQDKYGVILSIDGRGVVTLHYPENNDEELLTQGQKVYLNNSYELDDAPDFEKFYFITSDRKLDVKIVVNCAEQIAQNRKRVLEGDIKIPDIRKSIKQTSILINKGDSRQQQ